MNRNLLFIAILALVALGIWSVGRGLGIAPAMPTAPASARPPTLTETPGPPTPCAACIQTALASLAQEASNLRARQTQAIIYVRGSRALVTSIAADATQSAAETPAMSKANLLWDQLPAVPPYGWEANTLATASTADMTQSAEQVGMSRQPTQLALTPAATTQIAQAAAAQQKMGQTVSGRAPIIVGETAFQAQANVTPKPTPSTVVWMWLTPVFILATAVLVLWGVTRWQAQRQTVGQSAAPR
jgi:hypothetical protein